MRYSWKAGQHSMRLRVLAKICNPAAAQFKLAGPAVHQGVSRLSRRGVSLALGPHPAHATVSVGGDRARRALSSSHGK